MQSCGLYAWVENTNFVSVLDLLEFESISMEKNDQSFHPLNLALHWVDIWPDNNWLHLLRGELYIWLLQIGEEGFQLLYALHIVYNLASMMHLHPCYIEKALINVQLHTELMPTGYLITGLTSHLEWDAAGLSLTEPAMLSWNVFYPIPIACCLMLCS